MSMFVTTENWSAGESYCLSDGFESYVADATRWADRNNYVPAERRRLDLTSFLKAGVKLEVLHKMAKRWQRSIGAIRPYRHAASYRRFVKRLRSSPRNRGEVR